jgi:hypothetical protein
MTNAIAHNSRRTPRLLILAVSLGIGALCVESAAAQLAEKKVITLAAARKMVAAAEAEAERNHWAGAIAVVDDGGWPILIERMDHAALTAGVELAPGKARTAALFKSRARISKMRSTMVALRPSRRPASSRCRARFRSSSTAK